MSYEGLLNYLTKDAESQKQKIITKVQEEIDQIKQAGEEECRNIKDAAIAKASREIAMKKAKQVYEAQKQVQEPLLKAKSEFLENIFEKIEARIPDIPKHTNYSAILEKLVNEALEDCEGEVKVIVNKRDSTLAKQLLAKADLHYTLDDTGDFSGGIECILLGGKKKIRNTLEARFQRAKAFLKAEAAKLLYQ